MLTSERIAELRAAHEAVEPGEWTFRPDCSIIVGDVWIDDDNRPRDEPLNGPVFNLIALARNALPELLDEVERLRGDLYTAHSEAVSENALAVGADPACYCDDCTAHRAAKGAGHAS